MKLWRCFPQFCLEICKHNNHLNSSYMGFLEKLTEGENLPSTIGQLGEEIVKSGQKTGEKLGQGISDVIDEIIDNIFD